MSIRIINADVMDGLAQLLDESVHCVVTSPPYWGLRDYGTAKWDVLDERGEPVASRLDCDHSDEPFRTSANINKNWDGGNDIKNSTKRQPFRDVCGKCGAKRIDKQLGLEPTLGEHVEAMVRVFREVRRVLRKDGTLWLNYGDRYAGGGRGGGSEDCKQRTNVGSLVARSPLSGLKPKDLCGVPWRVAFALQEDGWWLRQDIIWSKPNPMPESIKDRCTNAHEYLFLLAKSERYYFDATAIAESAITAGEKRGGGKKYSDRANVSAIGGSHNLHKYGETPSTRNKRSVWEIATQPFNGAGFLADYVGADGKPYKRSEDCPIHGRRDRLQTPQMGEGDARSDPQSPRNLGNGDGRAAEREAEIDAIPSTTSCRRSEETSHAHDRQSTGGSKTLDPLPTHCADDLGVVAESLSHIGSIAGQSTLAACETGSPPLGNSETATPHSSGSHKTDRAPATNPACSASAQNSDGTGDTPGLFAPSDLVEHTRENSSEQGGSGDHPSGQKASRSGRKSSASVHHKCTCEPISTDHFATFPPALIEPCIKAGTSERGCCAKCGAPWVRETESQFYASSAGRKNVTGQEFMQGWEGVPRGTKSSTTLGWSPSCKCYAADTVPCTVLDPFVGSGTTGLVSDRLKRNAIGIELNPEYAAIAERRIKGDCPMFAEVGTIT